MRLQGGIRRLGVKWHDVVAVVAILVLFAVVSVAAYLFAVWATRLYIVPFLAPKLTETIRPHPTPQTVTAFQVNAWATRLGCPVNAALEEVPIVDALNHLVACVELAQRAAGRVQIVSRARWIEPDVDRTYREMLLREGVLARTTHE